jgi:hypothetical protein
MKRLFLWTCVIVLPLAGCGSTEPTEPTEADLMQQRQEINQRPQPTTMDEAIKNAQDWLDNDANIGIKKGYWTEKDYKDWRNQK